MSRQFECPVCLEIMRPPTKMLHCKNGHVLCLVGFPEKLSLSFSCIHIEQTCVQKGGITSCPSCRQPLLGRLIFSHILNCGIYHICFQTGTSQWKSWQRSILLWSKSFIYIHIYKQYLNLYTKRALQWLMKFLDLLSLDTDLCQTFIAFI